MNIASAVEARVDHYISDVWQVEEGLPGNGVSSVAQTPDGYLWIATSSGLARFDGLRFEQFDVNTTGLKSLAIVKLFVDPYGGLLIAMQSGQLARYADGKFTCFETADGWSMAVASSFPKGRSGDLLVTDMAGGVFYFRNSRFAPLLPPTAGVEGRYREVVVDAAGIPWAVNKDRHLGVLRGGRWEPFVPEGDQSPMKIEAQTARRRGGMWICAASRIRLLEEGRWTRDYGEYPWSPGNAIMCTHEDSADNLWIGTRKAGLFRIAPDGSHQEFSTRTAFPHDAIRDVCEDREGSIWVASEGGGLIRLRQGLFRTFGGAEGLSQQTVMALAEDSVGRLVLGTLDGGLFSVERGRVFGPLAFPGMPRSVWALRAGRSGNLWAGTYGDGLVSLHGERSMQWTSRDGLVGSEILSLHEDREGRLWIGTEHGLSCFDGERFINYSTKEGLSANTVSAITQDSAGNLWIGTKEGGINRFRNGKFTSFSRQEGLPGDIVTALLAGTNGVLWIGTAGGGLSRFSEGRFVNYSTKHGLPDNSIAVILDDGLGFLWLGTSHGICRVARSELEAFAKGDRNRVECATYLKADGLASIQCSSGNPAGLKTRDGRLWFATLGGVSMVDPRQIPSNPVPPPVVIEEVTIDGEVAFSNRRANAAAAGAAPVTGLTVPPGRHHLEIAYTGLSLTTPTRVRFRIQMEGFDRGWQEVGPRRVAFYDGLLPGQYRFRVLAANNDGLWNEAGAAFTFTVMPYFWQTWWFRGGLAISLAGIAFLLHWRRIASLERAQAAEVLRATNRFNEALLNSIPLGIDIVDKDGRVLFLNRTMENLIGTSSLGKTCWEVYKDDRQQCAECPLRQPIEVGVARTVETGDALGGKVFQITHTGMIFQGQKVLLEMFQDVTHSRQAQEKLQMLEQQKALEVERGRIAQDMHDEIGSTLTKITLLGEIAEAHVASQQGAGLQEVRTRLQRISAMSRQVVRDMDEIVWAVNPGNDSLEHFASYLCHFVQEFFKLSIVQCRLEIPPVLPAFSLESNVRHHLFLVVKEALNNVLKHSRATHATLKLEIGSDTLSLIIVDDGKGFDASQTAGHGNGLGNMRQRMKEIGGEIEITSQPGHGVRIVLRVGLATKGPS